MATPMQPPLEAGMPASLIPSTELLRLRLSSWLAKAFGFPACIAGVLCVLVYFLIPQSIADPDIWWHLRNAQDQLHSQSFIRADSYSFTARGAPWIDHEWLAEIPFYVGWRLGGPTGLYAVTVTAIEAIFLGVLYLSWHRSRSWTASLCVSLVAALLATVSFGPRTLLFGWLCLVVELLLLEHVSSHPRLIFLLPPLFALWINLHGSWLIGMVVFLVFSLGGLVEVSVGSIKNKAFDPSQRKRLLVSGLLSFGCLFLNPYGWRLLAYPFNLAYAQKLNIENVEEWKTLDFHSPRGRILLCCLAVVFVAQLLRRQMWTLCDLGFLAIGVYAAVNYSRFLFLAGLLVLPLTAALLVKAPLPDIEEQARGGRPWLNAAMLFFLSALVARHLPDTRRIETSGGAFPMQASRYLSDFQPQGKVFNDFLWGGFLIWHTPQIPVLIDSRIDIFEYRGVFRDYLDAIRLKGTLALLDKYNIRYVIFQSDTPLVYFLEHTSGWKIDYQDVTTTVLERSGTGSPRLANDLRGR